MTSAAPEDEHSWINKAMFWWVINVLRNFGRSDYILSQDNLCRPRKRDESRLLLTRVLKRWTTTKFEGKLTLFRCLLTSLGKDALIVIPAALMNGTSQLVQPFLVGEVVQYLRDPTHTTATWAYLQGAAIVVLRLINCLTSVQCFHPMFRLGMKVRAALACMIYKKTLDLKANQVGVYGSGHIVNLLSTDLEVIVQGFQYWSYIVQGPVVTCVCAGLIIREVGITSALPAIGFLFIIIIIGAVFSKLQAKLRKDIAARTDKRMQMINEIISAVNVVKMYAWEQPFLNQIHQLRRLELVKIAQNGILHVCNVAGVNAYHVILTFMVLMTYVHSGGVLTPNLAIRVYGWSSIIAHYLCISIITTLRTVAAFKSIIRIEKFLKGYSVHNEVSNIDDGQHESSVKYSGDVILTGVECSWNTDNRTSLQIKEQTANEGFRLNNINLSAKPGELIMIVGSVGAGKTTFLMALLDELNLQMGKVNISSARSYSSQEPWIFAASVRENIIFGDSYNAVKYQNILEACCLLQDIDSFSDGDQTQVGQRGLKLSGGQKARISLARASYKEADVYIFDDPLSAVDPNVGHQLFKRCISGLNTDKIRILVTHNTEHLNIADCIIVLEKGRIICTGSYDEVKDSSFLKCLKELPTRVSTDRHVHSDAIDKTDELKHNKKVTNSEEEQLLSDKYSSFIRQFWAYTKAGNLAIYAVFIVLLCGNQSLLYAGNWWLTVWSNKDVEHQTIGGNQSSVYYSRQYHSNVYTTICALLVLTIFLSVFSIVIHFYRASKTLHSTLIRRILKAPMSYFDSTPVGNIINNFSRDMGIVDLLISQQFMQCQVGGVKVLGSIVFATVVSPWSVIGVPPFVIVVATIRWFAVRGSKQYKNLESACKSPVYSHVSNTLKGHTVIRAFNRQHQFMEQFHDLLDKHTSAWNMFICINRWMFLCVGMTFSIYIMVLLIISFITGGDGGLVGFALMHAILCVDVLSFFTQVAIDLENHLTAVGRIQRSSDIPQEGPFETEGNWPENWPASGDLVLQGVNLQYPNSHVPVLKNISMTINDKEKIGIVGRTGAGKSSIMRAVLRLTEPSGIITLNSVNTRKIGLAHLRSNITAIPQDPVLFSGSVRRNLDPWDEHEDDKLWDILKQTQLDSYIRSLSARLETDVGASGSIFSAGQKQLVCLARALLRNNKLLLIDEATANVDHQTDGILQQTIRASLSNSTVLTIAHRIQTVMDSDRIMVMDAGELVEFDTPQNLLDNKDSQFYRLSHMSED